MARLSADKWAVVSGETEDSDLYTDEELERIQSVMKVAILYTVGYLFEHREEADHQDLVMTLRNLLLAIREGGVLMKISLLGERVIFEKTRSWWMRMQTIGMYGAACPLLHAFVSAARCKNA
ncbi:MAG: head-tail connector protein [Clostridiales bacterium]|nr:head-tail connector protein [Clostridiales bacterium]